MNERAPLLSIDTSTHNYEEDDPKRSLRRRPSSPSERAFVENVGQSEWEKVENIAAKRGEVVAPDETPTTRYFSWRTLWAYAGPGWLMSIAYVDPGNLESDLQAGAYVGYDLIWVLFLSTFLGLVLQILAAKLGVVTGKHLAEMCRLVYPRWASTLLWMMTEIAIVGSDVQEVLGSAMAFQILFGLPLWAGCLVTAFDTCTFLTLHTFGIRKLEAFFVFLIVIMLVCFGLNFQVTGVDVPSLWRGLSTLSVRREASTQAVGIVGAVIMPHNIFLHSALVQTRKIDRRDVRKVREATKYFSIEAAVALGVSFLINLAVLGVFAQGFYSPDCLGTSVSTACIMPITHSSDASLETQMSTSGFNNMGVDTPPRTCYLPNTGQRGSCQQIGLAEAGQALRGLLGEYGETVWAIGLLAAGQSSTMTGTYAGQFVMEGFLRLEISPWKRVALTRSTALIPALTVAVWSQRHPGASDHMDELLNVLQSIQLPFALLPVLGFTNSHVIMGREFVNSTRVQIFGWVLTGFISVINLYLVLVNLHMTSTASVNVSTAFVVLILGTAYFGFLLYLIRFTIRGD